MHAMVCHVAKCASNFTSGKTKWIREKSLRGIDWMYHYFNGEWIHLRSYRNLCTIYITIFFTLISLFLSSFWFFKLQSYVLKDMKKITFLFLSCQIFTWHNGFFTTQRCHFIKKVFFLPGSMSMLAQCTALMSAPLSGRSVWQHWKNWPFSEMIWRRKVCLQKTK